MTCGEKDEAVNANARAFCQYVAKVLAGKTPVEIASFFDFEVDDVFRIFRMLALAGVLKWDERTGAYRMVENA